MLWSKAEPSQNKRKRAKVGKTREISSIELPKGDE